MKKKNTNINNDIDSNINDNNDNMAFRLQPPARPPVLMYFQVILPLLSHLYHLTGSIDLFPGTSKYIISDDIDELIIARL